MDPAKLAKSGTEHAHQQAFFQWLVSWNRDVHRQTFAIPNGGARGDDARMAAKRGAELKAEGVKRGVPDIMCAWPTMNPFDNCVYSGLFIEMKIASGGVTSDFQEEWHERLTDKGYCVVTCYNWQEAANAISRYFGRSVPYRGASDGIKFIRKIKPNNP